MQGLEEVCCEGDLERRCAVERHLWGDRETWGERSRSEVDLWAAKFGRP
jgi:hypothetical protein